MDDVKQQLEEVRAEWAGRGDHWDDRADQVAEMADKLNLPLIQAADIKSGHRVIDLATGAGEPAISVARTVGSDGHVSATDLVPEMLKGAQRRVEAQGFYNFDFQIADMASLPHDSNSYDRAICRFGLMFSPQKQQAVNEVFRVLKPGGRVAYMVWGEAEDNTLFTAVRDAAIEVFGADNPLLEFDLPFSMSTPGTLKKVLNDAGFEDVRETSIIRDSEVPVGKPFWGPMVDMTAGRPRDAADPEMREAFDQDVERRFADMIAGDKYQLRLHAIIGSGVKPT